MAALVPKDLDDAFRLAKALSMSGDMIPECFQGKPEATMAALVRGMEIGLAPMQSLSSIAVINGRASLWGDALPALMQRAGHHVDVVIEGDGDNMVAMATLTRGDTGKSIIRKFSVDDAKKANLWTKKGPWQQYPKRMISLRARTLAVRDGAADALMGLQIAEEVQDYGPERARDVTPKAGGWEAKAVAARSPEPEQEPTPEPAHTIGGDILPDDEVDPPHWTEAIAWDEGFPGSEEYDEGVEAFKSDAPVTDCPHEGDPGKAADWIGGWFGAEKAGAE